MSRVYHVLPASDRDLDEQATYLLAEASLDTALRFYDAASVTFGKIAGMPGIGEQWPSANLRLAGLRVWRSEGFESTGGVTTRSPSARPDGWFSRTFVINLAELLTHTIHAALRGQIPDHLLQKAIGARSIGPRY
jgi:plasmid stabilization system protein ParE